MTQEQCPRDDELVSAIAASAGERSRTVAVAESLTAGQVSSLLGQGQDASTWYRGGVVAYAPEVKFDVLGVTPGPVVTDACARQMAEGVRRLLGADVAVGVTGVGGPDPQEGKRAGTVFLAVADERGTRSRELVIDGDPEQVVSSTTSGVLAELARALDA
ncbi:CinA family protein [Nocardioides KLBMP 9356]|uniref:CinA family protein n=1 Tax=Nocardioides potassii TaxID=2911371 RepID=A0ABS9HDL5_9ACTN|nr:CinA family protein [Nocardioides potassii]MCF6378213.1 CinA family protein [Nocardioides potassii]